MPLLVLIAIGGFVLRVLSLVAPGGPLASPSGYDDGVYFSAAALLTRGVLPYRDFVFVHPPGVLYFHALTSWWHDPAQAFAAARVVVCVASAINIVLVGLIARRAAGPFAGIVAATLYAIYPDAVIAERTTYLEPILNLFALSSALVWLRGRGRGWAAGSLAGAACAVKLWGGIWVIAAIASAARSRFRTDVPRFLAGASAAGLVLLAPVALPSLGNFLNQVLRFQVSRPPDGVVGAMPRLREILSSGHLAATALAAIAIVALLVAAIRRREVTREQRFFTIAVLLTIAGFVASSSYWSSYNAHLAASQCVLAGLGASTLAAQRRGAMAIVALLVVALQWTSFRDTLHHAFDREPPILAVRDAIRNVVPPDESVFAFDPTWTLAGGRLPPHGDGAPIVVDSYGAMLLDAVQRGGRFSDTGAAFQNGGPQRAVRARLAASRYAILGWRGSWQLTPENRAWFAANFLCATPEAGDLCVWQRLDAPLPPRLAIAQGDVQFGKGWYAEEGTAPASWRWMSSRSVTTLPPSSQPMRLQLHFYTPIAGAIVFTELDGRRVDQFFGNGNEVIRSIDVETTSPHPSLVITVDRTMKPLPDPRELGVSLKRLVWLPRSAWPVRADGASTSLRR